MTQGEISTARRRRRGFPPEGPSLWGWVFLALLVLSVAIFAVLFVQSWSEVQRVPARLVLERLAQLSLVVVVLLAARLVALGRRVPWLLLGLTAALAGATGVLMMTPGTSGKPRLTREGEAILDRLRKLPLEQEVELTEEELKRAGGWRPAIEAFARLHGILRRTVEPLAHEVDQARRGRSAVIDELVMVDPLERARAEGRLQRIARRTDEVRKKVESIRKDAWEVLGVPSRGIPPMVRGGAAGQAAMGHIDDLLHVLGDYRLAVREAGIILDRLKRTEVGCSAARLSLPPREMQSLRYRFERVFRGQRELAGRLGCDPGRVRLMHQWRLERALPTPLPDR